MLLVHKKSIGDERDWNCYKELNITETLYSLFWTNQRELKTERWLIKRKHITLRYNSVDSLYLNRKGLEY